MSVVAYALTSVARVKSFLGITSSDYDSILESLINSVTDFIEKECDRRFKKTSYSGVKLDGEGTKELVLPNWPVDSSSTFKLYEWAGSDYGDDVWDEIDSDDYRVDYDAGIVKMDSKFLRGFQNYKVDYTAGYDFNVAGGTYPSDVGLGDLELVAWKLIGRVFSARKGGGDIQSIRLYNYAVTFTKEAYSDDEIKEVLVKYKRISF